MTVRIGTVHALMASVAPIEAAFVVGTRLGLLATVSDTITALERDTRRYADEKGLSFTLESRYVAGAMDALSAGDRPRHDALVAEAAAELENCQGLMLAQHSMGPVRRLIKDVSGRKVLTSPDTAASKLKRLVVEG